MAPVRRVRAAVLAVVSAAMRRPRRARCAMLGGRERGAAVTRMRGAVADLVPGEEVTP